jgi:hypothetical protein
LICVNALSRYSSTISRDGVSDEQVPLEAEGDQASAKLNEGLKTCHAMVTNYRTMLTDALCESPAYVQSSTEAANDAEAGGVLFASSSS